MSWNGCGRAAGFSAAELSTHHHPMSRLSRADVDLQGEGYGGGMAGDEATDAVATPKGYWAAEGGEGVGDRGQVPPATEN